MFQIGMVKTVEGDPIDAAKTLRLCYGLGSETIESYRRKLLNDNGIKPIGHIVIKASRVGRENVEKSLVWDYQPKR